MGRYYDGWVTQSRRVKTCERVGNCMRCGAKLSVYRKFDELYCAPCTAALAPYWRVAPKKRAAEVPPKASLGTGCQDTCARLDRPRQRGALGHPRPGVEGAPPAE